MTGDVVVAPAEPATSPNRTPSRASEPDGARDRSRAVLWGLLLLSFVGSLLISRFVFPHFSTNNDEPVYVVQARMLLEHHLTLPDSPDSQFFRPWMSGRIGDRLVMVFPPVLPALLALGQWLFGSMRVTLALLAAAGVLAAHRLTQELTGDRRAALYAAFILAICPFFLIQSGLFLAYVLALDLELAMAGFLVTGSRRGTMRWFVAAGGALGLLAFARPFDALLAGVPLVAVGVAVGAAALAGGGPAAGGGGRGHRSLRAHQPERTTWPSPVTLCACRSRPSGATTPQASAGATWPTAPPWSTTASPPPCARPA